MERVEIMLGLSQEKSCLIRLSTSSQRAERNFVPTSVERSSKTEHVFQRLNQRIRIEFQGDILNLMSMRTSSSSNHHQRSPNLSNGRISFTIVLPAAQPERVQPKFYLRFPETMNPEAIQFRWGAWAVRKPGSPSSLSSAMRPGT